MGTRLFRRQILTLGLMTAGYSGYYFCRSNFSIVLPNLISELTKTGLSVSEAKIILGKVASISVLGYALGKFLNGATTELLGGRRCFVSGMLGSVLFTVIFASGASIPIFTISALGNRLFQSLGWVSIVKLSSRWFSYSSYGTAMGIVSLSFLFGDAIARKTLSYFLNFDLGWQEIYLVSASILFILFLLNYLFLRDGPSDIGEKEVSSNPEDILGMNQQDASKSIRSILKILLTNRVFLLICFLSFACTLVRETFNTWTTTYFTEYLGLSQVDAAANSAWFPLFGGVSVLLSGFLSDRLGRGGRASLIFYGLFLATILLLVLGHFDFGPSKYWHIFVVALIAFVLIGPYSYLAGAMALDVGGKRAGSIACGIIDGTGYLGGYLSGELIVRVSVLFGWKGAFTSLAIVTFLSCGTALLFLQEQRRLIRTQTQIA